MRTENLLKQSQSLAQELQVQQDELTETNRRLEHHAKTLQASETLLTRQQEELQQTNQELQEKAHLLAMQNAEVERKNNAIEQAKLLLEEKAEQLASTSKYKSEFLANMSHELRTPLNSLLILSKLLAENSEGNLTQKQQEFAQTVHSAGAELLSLINDILDLSKIESGMATMDLEEFSLNELKTDLERSFRPVAEDRKLDFSINIEPNTELILYTDLKRLQQVLKNLLSNAFKFTEKGNVTVSIYPSVHRLTWGLDKEELRKIIAFSVTDTGIGIAPDKQKIIFEAFQQADGTTSRKYGGTGLGLAISREIATLLGGEIKVESTPGSGSKFTLYIPQNISQPGITPLTVVRGQKHPQAINSSSIQLDFNGSKNGVLVDLKNKIQDDRDRILPGDKVILVIESDIQLANSLLELAHQHNFKCLITGEGENGPVLARRYRPNAITLNLGLTDVDGWKVFNQLKQDTRTCHIPVHVVSIGNGHSQGHLPNAIGYLEKPITKESLNYTLESIKSLIKRPAHNLLLIEHDSHQRNKMVELIRDNDIEPTAVDTGESALKALRENHYDGVVIDLSLPDMTGFELVNKVQKETSPDELPVFVYTAPEIHDDDQAILKLGQQAVITKKGNPQQIIDEIAQFLEQIDANLPIGQQYRMSDSPNSYAGLANRKILIVDDDVRNIFAVTAALERHNLRVMFAENGSDGIETLKKNSDIDCVLMDVMMPDLDGYETMQQIRRMEKYADLPIIALTARAMIGDREKCLEAGASDYLAKPVDTDKLISLLQAWLCR